MRAARAANACRGTRRLRDPALSSEFFDPLEYGEVYLTGNQRNKLALVNGFGELLGHRRPRQDRAVSGPAAGLSRQQSAGGANVSTNLPSPVFDGFRAYRDWGHARVDAIGVNAARS